MNIDSVNRINKNTDIKISDDREEGDNDEDDDNKIHTGEDIISSTN